jgi:hypothetical protein
VLPVTHLNWDFFSALEQELEASQAVIDIHQDNYHLTSEHYSSIIVKSCAEIERIYGLVCGKTLEVKSDIKDCIHAITDHCHDFFNTEIHMPMNNQIIKPWSSCAQGNDPEFWKAYHVIQHATTSAKTTLEHAIHSLAALFALLLALD